MKIGTALTRSRTINFYNTLARLGIGHTKETFTFDMLNSFVVKWAEKIKGSDD